MGKIYTTPTMTIQKVEIAHSLLAASAAVNPSDITFDSDKYISPDEAY